MQFRLLRVRDTLLLAFLLLLFFFFLSSFRFSFCFLAGTRERQPVRERRGRRCVREMVGLFLRKAGDVCVRVFGERRVV